jgi:hypothetical protein
LANAEPVEDSRRSAGESRVSKPGQGEERVWLGTVKLGHAAGNLADSTHDRSGTAIATRRQLLAPAQNKPNSASVGIDATRTCVKCKNVVKTDEHCRTNGPQPDERPGECASTPSPGGPRLATLGDQWEGLRDSSLNSTTARWRFLDGLRPGSTGLPGRKSWRGSCCLPGLASHPASVGQDFQSCLPINDGPRSEASHQEPDKIGILSHGRLPPSPLRPMHGSN